MALDIPGGLFGQEDVRETPVGTSSATVESTTGFTSAARAYRTTSSQTIPTNTATKIQLNAESYDGKAEFASYKFTATDAGYYVVSGQITYPAVPAGKYFDAQIRLNGTEYCKARIHSGSSSSYNITAVVSDIIYMTAGQYLELYGYHATGSDEDAEVGTDNTFLAIHRIS